MRATDSGGKRVQVRRAGARFLSRAPGVQSWHCFSFGPHYDPANTGFGALVLHDEHLLEPGAGFDPHPHRGVEVVSWVLEGVLVHEDALGGRRELGPGSLQHLSAGRGVVHAEHAGRVPTRFVQAWLLPDQPPASPSYVVQAPADGGLAPVRTVAGAVLSAGRLARGATRRLGGPLVHVFVANGVVRIEGKRLQVGDAARCSGPGQVWLVAEQPAELLVWEMQVAGAQE